MTKQYLIAFCGALVVAGTVAAIGAQTVAPPARAFDVVEKSIFYLQSEMEAGRLTSRQVVEAYLARIRRYDKDGPKLNAFITLNPRALDEADALDRERKSGRSRGSLHGIPIAVKDNYVTADMPTTAGTKALEGFLPGRDAFMVKKLRDAGAIIIGKTNLHELAYGITSISSMGGQTLNPYDVSRNPGGSSGGTGAAIAASFAAAGMGTDTCGSIRNPASSNNLFGLRGTRGLSSRDGIVPLAHSQDIGGPLARNVTDLAIMLDATVGLDPADAVTKEAEGHRPRTYLATIGQRELGDVSIGVVTSLFGTAPEDAEVAAIVRKALDTYSVLGASVTEVTIPDLDRLLAGTSTINAEFKFDLNDFLGRFPTAPVKTLAEILKSGKYGSAVEGVLRRADAVESRTSEAYEAALAKREEAEAIIGRVASGYTALAYPTLRRKPATIGQAQGGSNCQISATTGLPALSMPVGFTDDGLPVGMELLGAAFSESTLLRVAYVYERTMNPRKPPKTTP